MPSPSDPRNLRAKWQRALDERRKASAAAPDTKEGPPAQDGGLAKERVARAKERVARAKDGGLAKERVAPAQEEGPLAKEGGLAKDAAPGGKGEGEAAEKVAGAGVAAGPKRVEAVGPTMVKLATDDEPEKQKDAPPPGSPWGSVVAALVLVGGIGLALRTFLADETSAGSGDEESALDAATGDPFGDPSGTPLDPARAPLKPRCAEAAKEPYVIGDPPAPKPAAPASDGEDPREDELAPFAVELGRGAHFEGGFAVGTQRQAEGGTVAMIAVIGDDGGDGRLVRLARSRGDFDPPVVATTGSAILAAMMEPNAGGRSIRIAKVEGERVTWGPELSESNDESLAVDIAASGAHAMVVWDDVPLGRERSVIELATFDVGAMRGSGARPVTPPSVDADLPRLAPRPGGFWLSYMVHGDPPTTPTAETDDEPEDAGPRRPGKHKAPDNPDDSDTEAAGEAIAHQWIELVPLDESGFPSGAPRAVTPKNSRVIGYDLDDGEDGRAVILYREDDTPSGSSGGRVKLVIAELGGVSEPRVIADEGVGSGIPMLYGGWIVIHSLAGPVRLGAIGPRGDLVSELAPERSLKLGEVLTAHRDAFLIATPAGRAMKLGVVRCTR